MKAEDVMTLFSWLIYSVRRALLALTDLIAQPAGLILMGRRGLHAAETVHGDFAADSP